MAILIIRHGEKPEAKDDPHLSEKGRQRAQALVALFRTCFRAPDKLYAAADKPKSYRPRETLEPIARRALARRAGHVARAGLMAPRADPESRPRCRRIGPTTSSRSSASFRRKIACTLTYARRPTRNRQSLV